MTEAWESLFCGVVVFGLEESGILQMGEHEVLGNAHEVNKNDQILLERDVSEEFVQ